MNLSFKNIQSFIIVLLIAGLFLVYNCTPGLSCDDCAEKTITVTETKWDTITIVKPVYIPKWKDRIVVKLETITEPIDTLAVLQDYYAKYFYSDIVELDSLGFITINDTISRNKIMSRSVITSLNIPTTTVTHTKYINTTEVYWGVGIMGNKKTLDYIGAEFLLKTKKKQIFGLGVGLNENLNVVVSGRVYFKFNGKK